MLGNNKVVLERPQSLWRWLILTLGCTMMVGLYYATDIPAALYTQIKDHMGNSDDYAMNFSLLYTLYSSPNLIIPFFGGFLVDRYLSFFFAITMLLPLLRFGYRNCLLIFSCIFTTGQVIFTLGLMVKSWPILFLGRLVFGFGSDSFIVGNSTLLSSWFKGKELAFAFGINLAISRLGSVMNNILSPQLANNISIVFASWFAVILCGFGIMSVLCVYPVDHLLDKVIAENSQQFVEPLIGNVANNEINENDKTYSHEEPIIVTEKRSSSFSHSNVDVPKSLNDHSTPDTNLNKKDPDLPLNSFKDVLTLQKIFWVLVVSCVVVYGCVLPFNNISSSLLLERDFFKEPSADCQIQNPLYCENDLTNPYIHCPSSKSYQPPLPYNLTDKYYPLSKNDIDCTDDYWKDSCATSEYCSRLTDAETQASFVMSIPFIISAALSPPTGFLVDIYGCRAIIATLAPAILIIVHSFLALSTVSAVGPLVGQGLAYTAFVSVLWPSIPLVIEEKMTGLAFGIAFSMQNLGCTIFPLVIAAIYSDSNDHYIPNTEFLFIGLASIGVFVGLYLNYYDYRHNNVLNRPGQKDNLEKISVVKDGDEENNPLIR